MWYQMIENFEEFVDKIQKMTKWGQLHISLIMKYNK